MPFLALWSKLHRRSASVFVRALAIQTAAKHGHDFHNALAPLCLGIFFFMTQYHHFNAQVSAKIQQQIIGEAQ